MMSLDEFRNLDPKEMPDWPIPAQLFIMGFIIVLLVFLGYFFALSDQMDKLKNDQQQEEQLKHTFIDKKRQAINLQALQLQLEEIQRSFGALLRQLPTKSNIDTLLTEVNQAGTGRGLQFELFRPQAEIKTTEMAEMPIDIKLTGSYSDLASFVSDVAQLSRIVTIEDINLEPAQGNGSRLTLNAKARTYRALEPEERAAQLGAQPKK